MRVGQPSQIARRAAAYRAVHQTLDGGAIFKDQFASRILDKETATTLNEIATDESARPMRLFIAARSRLSEDTIANCLACGVRQVAVLGAGLDTFSLRNPYSDFGLRVFEVDHPATQAWKRNRIREAGLSEPPSLVFVPIDFKRERLADRLTRSGFRVDEPALFQWLGVVPYLTRDTVSSTLKFMAELPQATVVFDYAEPFHNYPVERRATIMETAEKKAAARGNLGLFFRAPRAAPPAAQRGVRW